MDRRQDSLSRRRRVGASGLPAHPHPPGAVISPSSNRRRWRAGRVSREGDSGPAGRPELLSSGPSGGLLSWKGAEQGALSPALGGSKSPAPVWGSLLSSPHRPTPPHSFQPPVRPENPLPSGREGSPARAPAPSQPLGGSKPQPESCHLTRRSLGLQVLARTRMGQETPEGGMPASTRRRAPGPTPCSGKVGSPRCHPAQPCSPGGP